VFDKTGTLTEGTFTVTAVHPESVSEAELLDIAAAAESYSNHPIASSIVRAHGGHIDKSCIGNITELPGLGVKAYINGKPVCVGNGKLMEQIGADWHECHMPGTIVHITVENEYMGHIVISDRIKPDAERAVAELKRLGVTKTVMLTGDIRKVGEAVGHELKIDETHSELLPDNKVAEVEKLLAETKKNGTLVFVGDGVNDAPVLARADVGIAMGALGSEAAIEAADIVLTDDKPFKIAEAIVISRKTMLIVRENIIFALSVKAAVLILGACGFANMWFAVFADVGVMLLAIINSMRTLKKTEKPDKQASDSTKSQDKTIYNAYNCNDRRG
jgi:ATPase, P-type (transporting), HAD superfamily, subfamily IC